MHIKQLSTLGLITAMATLVVACNHNTKGQGDAQSSGSVGGKAFAPVTAFFTATPQTVTTSSAAADAHAQVGDFNAVIVSDGNTVVDPNALGQLPGNANAMPQPAGNANSMTAPLVGLAILTQANACDEQQANQATPNNTALLLAITGVNQPGTYSITRTSTGELIAAESPDQTVRNLGSRKRLASDTDSAITGTYVTTDSACKATPDIVQAGTLTFTTFDITHALVGSYEVTLTSGDKLSGTFNAANCPASTSNATPNCGG